MKRLLVRDLMTEDVLTLDAEDDLTTLYDLMEAKHIRHIPVVDSEGVLKGLVSHRDLIRSALFVGDELPVSSQRELLRGVRVQEIMRRDVETVEPDQDLLEAARVMLDNKFGCLPVIEGDQLVGIITEADFVRYIAEHLPELSRDEKSPGPRPATPKPAASKDRREGRMRPSR